eukprot:CAMPEP_0172559912 /NCGR_PEP_ID=MMETSP1067-20121228/86264_1 /TAXON_ID=265564 ORGANISM="Thalassiosira punctigera, Strain Tpunct2005C2" /NCGR_SAMPLE_ID=MMETSP1067 /ASSEMBLY_ACC=CAM_ASM_000444 /LENGTH=60 /DNA_ID=CAMNT_0013349613 /DNA_START=93 /DNA_END=272 /DNA_ORIENTATION=+
MGWLNSGPVGGESDSQSDHSTSSPSDVKCANDSAQLLSKLSSMEAAHIEQLHEVTSQMAE